MKCWNCQLDNREGLLVCERCGKPLFTGGIANTRKFSDIDPTPTPIIGTTRFPNRTRIKLIIAGAKEPLMLDIDERLSFGRTGADVDLTSYNAEELGVSRVHFVLERNKDTLQIIDKSSNGTWVGQLQLKVNTPYPLTDSSHIWAAKLDLLVFYTA